MSALLIDNFWYQSSVAYIDVLGWKQLVARSLIEPELRTKMATSLDQVRERLIGPRDLPRTSESAFVSQFSDSILLSMPFDGSYGGPRTFVYNLKGLCVSYLTNGFFLRGGLTFGLMHHDQAVMFGPALTKAALLEKSTFFPRIEVEADGDDGPSFPIFFDEPPYDPANFEGIFRRDPSDGVWHLDFLGISADELWQFTDEKHMRRAQRDRLELLRSSVANNVEMSRNQPDILRKAVWLAEYFNEHAKLCGAGEIAFG